MTFLARLDRLPAASSGNPRDSVTESGTEPHTVQSIPLEDFPSGSSSRRSPPVQRSHSTEHTTDGWLECSFVFPNPDTLLQVNMGDFALHTKKTANLRLLDSEARFCCLLQTIRALPLGQRILGDVNVEEEILEALNKIHRIKERQWTSQAHPDGYDGLTVDNSFRFTQRRVTDATPTLLAALIMYIKNRTSVRSMRVNLALLRCILRGFAKKHGIQSEAPSLVAKDIHTIVNHFDLNPTLHVSILCPRCYALCPFTEEVLTEAENALQRNAPLPRSSTAVEAVPVVPPLDYNQIPDGWTGANPIVESDPTSHESESELSEASFSSKASSIVDPDSLPPVLKPAPGILFNKDQDFEDLKSKLLNLSARAPSLYRSKKAVLEALCQDLNILYGSKETRRTLAQRLLLYRQENGANDDTYSEDLRYGKLKRNFEEDELSKATLMSWPHKQLERLCQEYRIPPFNSSNPKSLKKEDMVRRLLLWYLRGVLELFPDAVLSSNHHLALHVVTDLESMGPGHARSTPVFERINHFLQEAKKNGHLGEVEATMMTSYSQMANLQHLLEQFPELREEIEEALEVLKEIEREDHRAWSSTEFKETLTYIEASTLTRIVDHLCVMYQNEHSCWEGKVTRQVQEMDGVALGRVIYSSRRRENSIVFRSEGKVLAGTIVKVIKHSHIHPATKKMVSTTYLEVIAMQPISEGQDDLYRILNCGWLCLQTSTTGRTLTVPLGDVISHFVRTDLTLLVNGTAVTHVYPVPKASPHRSSFVFVDRMKLM
ncbi:hypothetical protein EV360DRAFT_65672 [Lentinula raphanica]|nr:hypothetical protein EV360DRAFT_65672 [Lentinula raphanica]